MTQAEYERPRTGVAQLAPASDIDDESEDSPFTPEIVPIAEGEVTVGAGSEERTEWERNPLKAATEAGAFDHAKLVRGQAALNPHRSMDEQLSPDDIVGDAGTFHYEEGRGPVSNDDGAIVDDHIARLVENELVEISPDMLRSLGEWDDGLADGQGAHPVDQIVDVPRMTILDRGAGANAELGPAETEALAALPEYDDIEEEPHRPMSTQRGDPDSPHEQLAQLQYLRFWPDPVPEGDEEPLSVFDSVADDVDAIDGVTAILNTETDSEGTVMDAELLAVLHSDRANLGTLNSDLMEVLDETPFEVGSDYNWVPELDTEYLAPGDESNSHSPTGADAVPSDPANAGADSDPSSDTETMTDDDIENLSIEQLAARNEAVADLKDQRDTLESEKSDLEDEVDDKADQIETLEDENETLEDEAEFSRRQAAMIAAGGNEGVADTLVDSDRDGDELAEMALESEHGPEVLAGVEPDEEDDDPEEEQLSARERLQEQLADGRTSPRGGGSNERQTRGGGGGAGSLSEEQLAAANERATAVMGTRDLRARDREQLSSREYVKSEYDIDPAEYESKDAFRAAVRREGGEA
jgi:hypothetical protein